MLIFQHKPGKYSAITQLIKDCMLSQQSENIFNMQYHLLDVVLNKSTEESFI